MKKLVLVSVSVALLVGLLNVQSLYSMWGARRKPAQPQPKAKAPAQPVAKVTKAGPKITKPEIKSLMDAVIAANPKEVELFAATVLQADLDKALREAATAYPYVPVIQALINKGAQADSSLISDVKKTIRPEGRAKLIVAELHRAVKKEAVPAAEDIAPAKPLPAVPVKKKRVILPPPAEEVGKKLVEAEVEVGAGAPALPAPLFGVPSENIEDLLADYIRQTNLTQEGISKEYYSTFKKNIKKLIEAGQDPNQKFVIGGATILTLLDAAISQKDLEFVEFLVLEGAKPEGGVRTQRLSDFLEEHTGKVPTQEEREKVKKAFAPLIQEHIESSLAVEPLWQAVENKNLDLIKAIVETSTTPISLHASESVMRKALQLLQSDPHAFVKYGKAIQKLQIALG